MNSPSKKLKTLFEGQSSSHLSDKRDLNSLLPVKWSKGHFFEKCHFSPVKNVKKCRGRDLNTSLLVKK